MSNTPPPSNDVPQEPAEVTSPDESTPLVEPAVVAEPSSPVEPDALVEPAEPTELVEPVSPEPDHPLDEAVATAEGITQAEPIAETAGYQEHIQQAAPASPEPAPVAPAAPVVQTVYITPPTPPKRKGNRGFGVLFGILSLIAFALLFVGAMALVLNILFPGEMVERVSGFIGSTAFIVPLAVFFVAFVALVVIANRASWWAYVLGSFMVAAVVYFGSIGVVLLTVNVFAMTPTAAAESFIDLATSPSIIIAAVLAREVTIWFGAAVASRGRKVTARNLEARAEYERELDNQPMGFA